MAITVGVVVVAFLCFQMISWWRSWTRYRHSPIRNWPVLGMLPGLLHNARRMHDYAVQVLRVSGYTVAINGPCFVNLDYVLTCDPVNVHHILSRNFSNYDGRPQFKMILEPFGDGIFNADGDSWKSQRKELLATVKHHKFESAFEKTIVRKIEKSLFPVLDHFSKLGTVVDIQDVFERFSFDSSCQMTLGFDPNSLSGELCDCVYQSAFEELEESVIRRHIVPQRVWKLQKWLEIGEERKFLKALETYDRFLYESISLKRQKLIRNSHMEEEEFDILTAFLIQEEQVRDHKGSQMNIPRKSDKYLRDVAFNMVAAGRDTITSALTWFMWILSKHPSVETKILEEIKSNCKQTKQDTGDHWSHFTSARELHRLVYLHAALYETMRLYPVIPLNQKTAVEADILPSGHHINQNTKILISYYSMGRMEDIWGKDCLEFKPERWISEKGGIINVPSYKFPAFNAGPRTCLGKDLALVQLKMIASAMIWNYRIQVVEGQSISLKNSMALAMKHGLKLRLYKRNF